MSESKPQRKSPRKQGYDYSQSGAYFVTVCTHDKRHLFGSVHDDLMHLNDLGQLTYDRIGLIPDSYDNVELSDYVVMPNHVHMIVFLYDAKDKAPLLSNIVGGYKSGVTRVACQELGFRGTLWQGRFHDHIIRSEASLNDIRFYVQTNPARWGADRFNE